MRVIHLCFQLHQPFKLVAPRDGGTEAEGAKNGSTGAIEGVLGDISRYFSGKKGFLKANREIYQPLFALLERNTQKYRDFRFSLMISGVWLEQAEKYDPELVERLKKMVKMGRVELVSVPYYYSLAFFYAPEELAEQARQYQDRLERLFGVTGRIFALPEYIYNNAVGKWAEGFGFAGMLVGGSARALDWRSSGHVYEAAGCEYLRLLVRNWQLSEMIERGDAELLAEKKVEEGAEGEAKTAAVFSVEKLRKKLDLEFLRGSLVNLYFDAGVFAEQRERGIIGFFDELIGSWLESGKDKFATAAEACVVETPTAELSVTETVSWRGDAGGRGDRGGGLVLKKEVENRLPEWLGRKEQVALSELVYGVRREVLASEDEKLIEDMRRLMLVDYHKGADAGMMSEAAAIVRDLKRRAEEAKKAQAVEISRAYTKKRDRGDVERKGAAEGGDAVKVNFGKSAGAAAFSPGAASGVGGGEAQGVEVEIGGSGGSAGVGVSEAVERAEISEASGVSSEAEAVEVTRKPKRRAVRKIIKKLVIE